MEGQTCTTVMCTEGCVVRTEVKADDVEVLVFFFQDEGGIRDEGRSLRVGDVYMRGHLICVSQGNSKNVSRDSDTIVIEKGENLSHFLLM
ncbi:hypothetical protein CR516_14340 [Enterococcus faecium]|nr:hypothetical protein CR516_14340 [Enterococcus faecium]